MVYLSRITFAQRTYEIMFRLELMVLLTLTLVGCGESVDLVLPSSAEIEAHYLCLLYTSDAADE